MAFTFLKGWGENKTITETTRDLQRVKYLIAGPFEKRVYQPLDSGASLHIRQKVPKA